MGVNTVITLPDFVRYRDVVKVLGAVTGMPMHREMLSDGSWAARVTGMKTGSTSIPECADIVWTTPDGEPHLVLYHFESESGGRTLYPTDTPFWRECGRQLVEFFGGTVDYSDCDNSEVDFSRPPKHDSVASDGAAWLALQERFMALGEAWQAAHPQPPPTPKKAKRKDHGK